MGSGEEELNIINLKKRGRPKQQKKTNRLSKSGPLVETEEALTVIRQERYHIIKRYTNPHPMVLMVLEVACTMSGEKN